MAAKVVTVDRDTQGRAWIADPARHGITLKNLFATLFGRWPRTIQFPEQKRKTSGRYRGVHILTQREDGTPKCVACYMCATVCPAECIYIEAGERPEADIEKYPTRFEIDLLRCVYCGFCVDACPEEAILMSRENDLVGTSREELIIDRDRLMDRGKLVEYGAGYHPDAHDVRRPVRIAALERLKPSTGSCPRMPRRSNSRWRVPVSSPARRPFPLWSPPRLGSGRGPHDRPTGPRRGRPAAGRGRGFFSSKARPPRRWRSRKGRLPRAHGAARAAAAGDADPRRRAAAVGLCRGRRRRLHPLAPAVALLNAMSVEATADQVRAIESSPSSSASRSSAASASAARRSASGPPLPKRSSRCARRPPGLGTSFGQVNQIQALFCTTSGCDGRGGDRRARCRLRQPSRRRLRHHAHRGDPRLRQRGRRRGQRRHRRRQPRTATLSVLGGFHPARSSARLRGQLHPRQDGEHGERDAVEEDNWAAAIEWAEYLGADVVSSPSDT